MRVRPNINTPVSYKFIWTHLIKKYNGRIDLALSHYNGGSRVIRDGKARILPFTLDYVARLLARSKHFKVALASDPQLKTRQELAVQMSKNHAKPKKRMDVLPHINHVDSWLTFIEELTPIRR